MTTKRSRTTTKRSRPSSIAALFPSQTLVKTLSLFLLHPDETFYQRDIAERTGDTLLQVQRALHRIERAGLLAKARRGNRVYYRGERSHPAFEDLRRAFLKTVALAGVVGDALAPLEGKIKLAFLFGSVAAGEERAASDVDLLVVGDVSLRQVAGVLWPVGRRLGRELNPVVYPMKEFRQKVRQRHHFLREVVAGPKIWLIGDENGLARLVG